VLVLSWSVTAAASACTGKIGGGEGDGSAAQPLCDGAAPQVGASPMRRLTRAHYRNSVRELLGLEVELQELTPDEKVGAFDSNAVSPVSELVVEKYMALAERLAAAAVADVDTLVACDRQALGDDACGEQFIADFGARAYRRSLGAEERQRYHRLFRDARELEGFESAIQTVLQAMLQSPYFLYHVETGSTFEADGRATLLTAHELASRLSFFLWGTPPDGELRAAVDRGELQTSEGLRAQAERMLSDDRAAPSIASFHLQWLKLDHLDQVEKDPELFPEFDAALRQAMKNETERFVDYVIRHGDGRLETLFTAPYGFPEGPLVDLYGVAPPPGHDPREPIELPADQRRGLLTQASVMATHAHTAATSPVLRGVFVRENVLCQPLPPPPPGVETNLADIAADATARERIELHQADPMCASCHRLIDDIGLGFENYDAIGRFRSSENGRPIDASGELVDTRDIDGRFDGALDLAAKLAQSSEVRQCVTKQWFRFALGRLEADGDRCSLEAAGETFEATNLDVRELLVAVVMSDAFRHRPGDVAREETQP
jgi:hypothetical protein